MDAQDQGLKVLSGATNDQSSRIALSNPDDDSRRIDRLNRFAAQCRKATGPRIPNPFGSLPNRLRLPQSSRN